MSTARVEWTLKCGSGFCFAFGRNASLNSQQNELIESYLYLSCLALESFHLALMHDTSADMNKEFLIWHRDTKSFRNHLSKFQKRLVWFIFRNWKLHKYHFSYGRFLGLTQRFNSLVLTAAAGTINFFYYYFVICGRKGTLHWLHWKAGRRPIKKDNCALKCLVRVLIHGQRQHHFALAIPSF